VWVNTYFATGLESNFYGFIASLFFIATLMVYFTYPKLPSSWLLLVIGTVNLLDSHYSSLTVLPAVVALCVAQLIRKRSTSSLLSYGIPLGAILFSALALFVAFPSFLSILQTFVNVESGQSTQYFFGGTYLSKALSSYLFVGTVDALTGDIPFIASIILSAIAIFFAIKKKQIFILVPIVWFATNAIYPNNSNTWRFSIEALIPLTIIVGYGMFSLVQRFGKVAASKTGTVAKTPYVPWKVALIILITLAALLVGSYSQALVALSVSNNPSAAQQSINVYNAIMWLGSNTPNDSTYLSTTDWRFTYADVLIGHDVDLGNVSTPSSAIGLALSNGDQYIIVSQPVIEDIVPAMGQAAWQNFPNASTAQLALVYSNPDVRIFSINNF
jgi:hypothetical protein